MTDRKTTQQPGRVEADEKQPSRRDLVTKAASLAAGAVTAQAVIVGDAQAAGATPGPIPGTGLFVVLGPDASGQNRLYFIDMPTLENFEITGAVPNPNEVAAGAAGKYLGVRAAMYGDGVNYRLGTYPNPELKRGKRLRRVPDLRPSVSRRETYNAEAIIPIYYAEAVGDVVPHTRGRRARR